GRYRLGKPVLVRGDAVEVSLDEEGPVSGPDRVAREVHPVEHLALRVERCLRGVQVLRRLVTEGATAERDHATLEVPDGEEEAAAEAIVEAAPVLPGHDEAGPLEDLLADLLASHEGEERVPALRRVPEVEALGDGGIDAPPLEVRPRALALRPPEPVRVEREGELHRAVQRLPLALVPAAAILREVDAGPAGERPDGLGEREPVLAHQEAERVAADAAAEAVEDALRRIHREGRRLLGVKGAEALPVRAGLAEGDELAHEVDQIDAGADLVEHRAREACHQPTLRAATVAPAPPSCASP